MTAKPQKISSASRFLAEVPLIHPILAGLYSYVNTFILFSSGITYSTFTDVPFTDIPIILPEKVI
ncbi:hypothetical protein CE91St58_06330 [Lachnospiraceae bacterium]|nr:hypothetical protein CE91St58_06330 [Lachnospiraceae bacterium]